MRQGERNIQAGEFSDAISPLKEAAQILSTAPARSQSKVWNLLGVAYQGAKQFDAASQAYQRALKFDHDNVAADFNLGCLRFEQQDFPGAVDYFTTYVEVRPKDINGYLKLGTGHYRLALLKTGTEKARQLENARVDIGKAEKIRPTAEAANIVGLIELQRRNGGADAVRAGVADFRAAVQRDPHYAPALLNLAIVSQRYLNDLQTALQACRQYLAFQPPPPHAVEVAKWEHELDLESHITIGMEARPHPAVLPRKTNTVTNASGPMQIQKTARPEAPSPRSERQVPAMTAVSQAPAPAPPIETPNRAPASTSETIPQNVNASAPADTASPAEVRNPPAANENVATEPPLSAPPPAASKTVDQQLNPTLAFGGKPKTGNGIAPVVKLARYSYPPGVTLIPGNRRESERLVEQGAQARQQSRANDALELFRQAVAADPTDFKANLQLGLTAIDTGDMPLALDSLYRALAVDANSVDARYAFAWTLSRRGYYFDAARELEKLVASHPQEVRAHLLLGNLYAEELGQPRQAREHYDRVLALDPGNAQAAAIRAWIQGTR